MRRKIQAPIALGLIAASVMAAVSSFAQAVPNDRLFKQRCAACHTVIAGGAATIGPNLRGVAGRKSGTTRFAYSPAMKSANITWTTVNLDRYLSNPARMVPGTRMVVSVPDPAQRAEIVRYLASVR